MTRFTTTTTAVAALLATTSLAFAGGIERNGFTTGIFFEEGNYVELSYTSVSPEVSGQANAPVPGTPVSGDMTESYGYLQFSYHHEVSDDFSISVVVDEPVGASVAYPGPFGVYPFALSTAELNSQQITIAGRYQINDNISVYAGLRAAEIDGNIFVTVPAEPFAYALNAESDTGYGYLIGAAYERPDIALRVALTYFSEIDLTITGMEGVVAAASPVAPAAVIPSSFEVTLPDSILLEAQSGVAEDTLVFGSVRWVDWSEFNITPGFYPPGALVSYENDTITYTLGVARRLSDDLVVLGSITHEGQNGGFASNLGPTDGRTGLGIGGRYTMGDWELSGGINYTWIGDADTSLGAPLSSSFVDNTAVGFGVRVGYRF